MSKQTAYVISKIVETPARYAVDGKAHKRTNYFAGYESFGGIRIQTWRRGRKNAKIFNTYREANAYVRALGEGKIIKIER